jgi:uncharacterized protein YciW
MDNITITRPDDWHLHLRDGNALKAVLPDTARRFARAIVMPNLRPPVTTTALAAEYRQRLVHLKVEQDLLDAITHGAIEQITDTRLRAMLTFTRTLITDPVKADQAALKALPQAGLSTPEVVTLAQLIAFVSYQVRVVAGLKAMKLLEQQA